MNYNKKIIISIFFLVTMVVVFFLYKFLAIEIKYTPVKFNHINTVVPHSYSLSMYSKNDWTGKTGTNLSQTKWIYILKKSNSPEYPLENFFSPEQKIKVLNLNSKLVFGVQAKGKSFRRYIYLLRHQDDVYWLESGSSRSTLIQIKTIADQMMSNFLVEGNSVIPDVEPIIRKTTAFVSPRYSQSLSFFIIILVGVMAFCYLIFLVVYYLSTREPREYEEYPMRIFKGVTIKINLQHMRIQMIDGNIAVVSSGILIYYFKKILARINFSDIQELSQLKTGTTLLLKQYYIQFLFPEPKSITLPGRKIAQKTKKITLYLKKSQVRQLIMETDFPFKDRLLFSDI